MFNLLHSNTNNNCLKSTSAIKVATMKIRTISGSHYTHTYARTYAHTHTYVRTHAHTQSYFIAQCTYVRIHPHTHVHMHTHTIPTRTASKMRPV